MPYNSLWSEAADHGGTSTAAVAVFKLHSLVSWNRCALSAYGLIKRDTMPHTDSDKKNAPYTLDTLREEASLVSRKPLRLDKRLPDLKAGSLAPETVEELLTKDFDKRLRPGLFSEPGSKWYVQHEGQRVALVVAQCPQRDAPWQIADGCRTNKYMQCLIDTVLITLTSSVVIAQPFA